MLDEQLDDWNMMMLEDRIQITPQRTDVTSQAKAHSAEKVEGLSADASPLVSIHSAILIHSAVYSSPASITCCKAVYWSKCSTSAFIALSN